MLVEEDEGWEVQVADVGVYEVLDEDLTGAGVPFGDDQVDVVGVDVGTPLFEDFRKFQLRQLSGLDIILPLPIDLKNLPHMLLGLLRELDLLISIDLPQTRRHQIINKPHHPNPKLFQHPLPMHDPTNHLILFPLNQHLAIRKQKLVLGNVVVDILLEVE